MVNYIHLDLYPLRTFNILYAVFTVSLHLRIFTERNVRKEEALYLRFFTEELKIRKFVISCCVSYVSELTKDDPQQVDQRWATSWLLVSVNCLSAI